MSSISNSENKYTIVPSVSNRSRKDKDNSSKIESTKNGDK